MNPFTRGVRNAFRNSIRTFSVVIILGLSIGLALTMLIARQAVEKKIKTVKSSIGNTITIAPAGFSNFSQVNNALTTSQLAKVQTLPHVTGLTETLTDRLTTIGSRTPNFGFGGNNSAATSNNQTSLSSPVAINLNNRRRFFISGNSGSAPTNFSLPITIIGTNNPSQLNAETGSTVKLSSGIFIDGSKDNNDAMVSVAMASKNNLKVGSTFTAYGQTMTVAGLFSDASKAADNDVVVSLPAEQRLSGQTGDVTAAVATVDSLDNLSSMTTAIKNTLGSAADVTSSQDQANQTVQPLNSVKNISLYSFIGAVVAGAVIILLIMIMIVRERRREIGVLKAIGASNSRIMFQFMSEAVTFTLLGAVIGLIIGVVAGSPVTNTLVTNSSNTSTNASFNFQRAGRPGGFANGGGPAPVTTFRRPTGGFFGRNASSLRNSLKNIDASAGWSTLLYGLAAAVLIAVVGSALASVLISKIRPAEVMRVE